MSTNAQTTVKYDHRTTFILNLLASGTKQAVDQVAAMVAYTKCPPARDTAYSDRDLLNRVWNQDAPTKFERQVAVKVTRRPHSRRAADGTPWSPVPCARLDEVKQGRTVRQMLTRGVTEADVRDAVRLGWLTLGDKT